MSDNIIQLSKDFIKHDLKDLVRSSVEETLNARKYERFGDRQGYRSGYYKRNFQTTAGEVELKVPKLKGVLFETAIIERYRRREDSVEDITEALWGTKVSPGTISNLN